jgi:hypothetical protein
MGIHSKETVTTAELFHQRMVQLSKRKCVHEERKGGAHTVVEEATRFGHGRVLALHFLYEPPFDVGIEISRTIPDSCCPQYHWAHTTTMLLHPGKECHSSTIVSNSSGSRHFVTSDEHVARIKKPYDIRTEEDLKIKYTDEPWIQLVLYERQEIQV